MRHVYLAHLFVGSVATFLLSPTLAPVIKQSTKPASPRNVPQARSADQARVLDSYGKLPLRFEANRGQSDGRVKFLSRSGGYTLFLTQDEAVLAMRGKADTSRTKLAGLDPTRGAGAGAAASGALLRMKLCDANPAALVTGTDELPGTSNYFIGNDPAKWRSNVPTYGKVKYEGIYPGIDLVYYGNQRQLEYDFIVAPGADPRRIGFEVGGAKGIQRDERGDLVLTVDEGEIRWHKPVAYQEKDGTRQEIAARYAVTAANHVSFEVAKYDAGKPLYIDPLIYSTYLGGSGDDRAVAIAVDNAGNAYVTGDTASTNFPTANPLQATYAGNVDAYVAKINPSGSALIYSTYLGGSDIDQGQAIAVDSNGNAYVTGMTDSADFPTANAFQRSLGGQSDAFVTELSPDGTALVYSTYLGGSSSDSGTGISVDGLGNAYVVGYTDSGNFPTKNPLQAKKASVNANAFVTKISTKGSGLVYSTYLGGSFNDVGYAIGLDSAGDAFVTGSAQSTDFPLKNPLQATQGSDGNYTNAFVTEIDSTGSSLVYSTYLGGDHGDYGYGIAVDGSGNVYVAGETNSDNFPVTPGAFETTSCCGAGFVSKINSTGSALVYSTYFLGGSIAGLAVDNVDQAYVTGSTAGNLPVTPDAFQAAPRGGGDAYVTVFDASGSALSYSTYLGGGLEDDGYAIAVSGTGDAYVTGKTNSINFPTLNPLQPNNAGAPDAFVTKFHMLPATTTALSSSVNPSSFGQVVTFRATVTSSLGPPPDGETVTFMDGATVLATVELSSGSASFTTSTLSGGTHSITVAYNGDSNLGGSTSAVLNQVVSVTPTTTSLSSSPNPSFTGQVVTFTAAVSAASGTPTGTVTFYNGSTTIASSTLSGGKASVTTSSLAPGSHTITAAYTGSAGFGGSTSAVLNQVVNVTPTTTSLSSSPNPSLTGQVVRFTAAVSAASGTPTGTVTFYDGSMTIASSTLSSGKASVKTSSLTPGSHSITAAYSGSADFSGSASAPVNQIVRTATTTRLTSSLNPSSYGQAVTLTAVVTSSLGTPPNGETVTFYNGTAVLGTGSLSSGSASFTTSTLPASRMAIKAVYGGDANLTASTSNPITQVVDKATTRTTLTSSQNPSSVGQSVTFTASVAPQFSGTVTGLVTFFDGTTNLKTVSLSGGVAEFTTAKLTSGAHTITAKYDGNAKFIASSASLTQTVN